MSMCNMEQETKTIPAVEVWKPVKGYEGIYEVSDHARVRSLDRIARSKHRNGKSFTRKVKGHIITQRVNNNGYMTVRLSKDGESKIHLVHRLVAVAFVPNPYELPFVNHKDDTPKNNMPDNLEWCTHLYNMTYKDKRLRSVLKQIMGAEKNRAITVADLIAKLRTLDKDRPIWIIKDRVSVVEPAITKATKDNARKYKVSGNEDKDAYVLENDYILNV